MLLCGILSDTLNLTSATTTTADRLMCVLLTILGDVERPVQVGGDTIRGPNELAVKMFKAKTNWFVGLGAYAICRGDMKRFKVESSTKPDGSPWKVAWATVEVTETGVFSKIADQLLTELRLLKREDPKNSGQDLPNEGDHLDFAFLTIVDIVNASSRLLICGLKELKLAQAMFPGCKLESAVTQVENQDGHCDHDSETWASQFPSQHFTVDQTSMLLGNDKNGKPRVSRKKQFIPPLMDCLNAGFSLDEQEASAHRLERTPTVKTTHVCGAAGCKTHRHYSDVWFVPVCEECSP
eukprot:TRINITY_DN26932_c0_g1_i2.p1 TRINITY_DN26932_c0_g1~~TRINITY_DN26932_c0_g1_i2.p1  ORF type:complete len:295 (+),score=69.84 TRINITY_DN26932_c0_g1_i2:328-1212(+)